SRPTPPSKSRAASGPAGSKVSSLPLNGRSAEPTRTGTGAAVVARDPASACGAADRRLLRTEQVNLVAPASRLAAPLISIENPNLTVRPPSIRPGHPWRGGHRPTWGPRSAVTRPRGVCGAQGAGG